LFGGGRGGERKRRELRENWESFTAGGDVDGGACGERQRGQVKNLKEVLGGRECF